MADLAGSLDAFNAWLVSIGTTWGYLGIFLVSLIGNASIILPVPAYLAVFAAGSVLDPWLVGLVAGAGAALGELTGYALGRGGKHVIEKKNERLLKNTKKWTEKHGLFPALILFAATPLPDDITGILAGIVSYNIKKFLLATFIGKVLAHWALAWAGFYGGQLLGGGSLLFSVAVAAIFMIAAFKFLTGETSKKK